MNSNGFINCTERINLAFSKICPSSIYKVLFVLNKSFESGVRIWIAGNGDSAATASHFVTY